MILGVVYFREIRVRVVWDCFGKIGRGARVAVHSCDELLLGWLENPNDIEKEEEAESCRTIGYTSTPKASLD